MSLIKNNNLRPLKRMAKRSIKAHPCRSFAIVLAIFICSGVMIFMPLANTISILINTSPDKNSAHVTYTDADAVQASGLSSDPHFQSSVFFRQSYLGQVLGHYTRLAWSQSRGQTWSASPSLIRGSFPGNVHEAAVDQALADALNLSPGDSISFCQKDQAPVSFTICGIVQDADLSDIPFIWVSEDFASRSPYLAQRPYLFMARFLPQYVHHPEDISSILDTLITKWGLDPENLSTNLTETYNIPIHPEHIILYLMLDGTCLAIGLLVIYSIFTISVTSRTREWGQMATLGMSQRQISRMILYEGGYLCLFGSLSGIIAGVFAACLVTGYWPFKYILGFSLLVFAVTCSFILLCLSRPARLAAAMSPAEAANSQGPMLQVLKGPKKPKGLQTPKTLALRHFQAHRKRMKFSMLSLMVAGILFILGTSYISAINPDKMARQILFQDAEYVIRYNWENFYGTTIEDLIDLQKQNVLNEGLIRELDQVPQVESVEPVRGTVISYTADNMWENENIWELTDRLLNEIRKDHGAYAFPDITREDLAKENGVIYNGYGIYGSQDLELGDKVTLKYFNGTAYQTIEVTIMGITSSDFIHSHTDAYGFLAPRSLLEKMYPDMTLVRQLNISTKDHQVSRETDAAIQSITDRHELIITDMLSQSLKETDETNSLVIALILSGCVIAIGFSMINLLNTMISQILSRNRELALLEAAGMTCTQIRKMLIYESLGLALPSAAVGILLGTFAGWAIITLLIRSGISYMTWHLPVLYGLLYIVLSILTASGISLAACHSIEKTPLTQRLKRSE